MAGFLFSLTEDSRERLSRWLSQYEKPQRINLGRWIQLSDGSTDYLSEKELRILNDELYPPGIAVDIIRGNVRVVVSRTAKILGIPSFEATPIDVQ